MGPWQKLPGDGHPGSRCESRALKPAGAGGWRIYEGGGGVKGKMLVFCFEWRSEQAPSDEAGGMRAQPHFSLGD